MLSPYFLSVLTSFINSNDHISHHFFNQFSIFLFISNRYGILDPLNKYQLPEINPRMSRLSQFPSLKVFPQTLRDHRYEHSKILPYLSYLMDRNETSKKEDDSMQIYKAVKKIILQKNCLDSLKGTAIFLMGIVMIGHIHIYEQFNKFILPGILSIYQEYNKFLEDSDDCSGYFKKQKLQKKDSLIEKMHEDQKTLQEWLAYFSNQLLILLGKWLPRDFYNHSDPSIYLKILKQNHVIKQTGMATKNKIVIYSPQLLKQIEVFVEKMNLGSENYCNLCWKYQVMNSNEKQNNKLIQMMNSKQRLTTRASQKIEEYRWRKIYRENLYQTRMNNLMDSFKEGNPQKRISTEGEQTMKSIKNSQEIITSSTKSLEKFFPNIENLGRSCHDKFRVQCFFNCSQFYSMPTKKQFLFKKYLIQRNNNNFCENLREIFGIQISEKIHKGIIKIAFEKNNKNPILIEPKGQLRKQNKEENYFLIDLQEKIKRIVFEIPQRQKKIIYPFGYIRMLQNCDFNQWQAGKQKLRSQTFLLNDEICPNIQAFITKFGFKNEKKNKYEKDKIYESFYKICKKIVKLTLRVNDKKGPNKILMIQGWCDEKIESIIILDEILSQIKFCFGKS